MIQNILNETTQNEAQMYNSSHTFKIEDQKSSTKVNPYLPMKAPLPLRKMHTQKSSNTHGGSEMGQSEDMQVTVQ